jgi:hypothetical protein
MRVTAYMLRACLCILLCYAPLQDVWALVPIYGEEWGRIILLSVALFLLIELEKVCY